MSGGVIKCMVLVMIWKLQRLSCLGITLHNFKLYNDISNASKW